MHKYKMHFMSASSTKILEKFKNSYRVNASSRCIWLVYRVYLREDSASSFRFVHHRERRRDYLQARERQRNRLRETNRDASSPSSSVCFFCIPFLSPADQSVQSAHFVCAPIRMSDTYVWGTKKSRGKQRESMRNGRPSRLPERSLTWRQSRQVTMNGRYYFIGDQAKSKIEKRTSRDERK